MTSENQQHARSGRGVLAPLPEHYYPPHRRTNVQYIADRARAIVPEFGGARAMDDEQVAALLEGAKVKVRHVDIDLPVFLLPPLPSMQHYSMAVRRDILPGTELYRAICLHEVAHALGGHFGPPYVNGAVTCLADYVVFEREADLFAAYGYLSAEERTLPARRLLPILLERIPLSSDEWVKVRAPWVGRALARGHFRRNTTPQRKEAGRAAA
jgi:hypothetical protein